MVAKLKSFINTYLPAFSKLTPIVYSVLSALVIGLSIVVIALDVLGMLGII